MSSSEPTPGAVAPAYRPHQSVIVWNAPRSRMFLAAFVRYDEVVDGTERCALVRFVRTGTRSVVPLARIEPYRPVFAVGARVAFRAAGRGVWAFGEVVHDAGDAPEVLVQIPDASDPANRIKPILRAQLLARELYDQREIPPHLA